MNRKVYSGYGLKKMMECAYRNKCTSQNSVLHITDDTDLDSKWYIIKEEI